MIGALLFLRLTSLRNLVLFRLRRLRQPKYLVGTAVAVAYIYFVVLRRTGMQSAFTAAPGVSEGDRAAMAEAVAAIICTAVSAFALIRIAYAWIAPAEKPGLRFTEAEIAFLFPAPVTRKTLIHFRLLSSQLAILFTSLLLVLLFGRFGGIGGSRLFHAVGCWVVLSVFDLHLTGTNLTLGRIRETGSHYVLWRVVVVAAIALYAAAVVGSAVVFVNAHPGLAAGSGRGLDALIRGLVGSLPFRWLVLPFAVVFAPALAGDAREFALELGPALGILVVHYYWVANTEARFEEGSIAFAEKRAAARAALLRGDLPKSGALRPRAQPGPFPLPPHGPPETAFLWKNLLSIRSRFLTWRTLVFVAAMFSWLFSTLRIVAKAGSGGHVYTAGILALSGIVAAYTLLAGPQIARQDLRNDLPNMDILKAYPVEGWRLALGELLAPAAVLSLVLWLCIAASAFAADPQGELAWLTPAVRVTVALCLGTAAPVLCLILLIVPNAIMLLLPGWYQSSRSRAGIEQFGQRMILGVGQLLIALLVAAPAAGAAALIVFSSAWAIGAAPAVALATLVALGILAGEAAVGLWWLGEMFVKFDLSSEGR